MANPNDSKGSLVRQIGFFAALMLLVGSIIGSGIFTVPGKMAAAAQAPGPLLLAWIVAGIACIFLSLVYAELAPMLPQAGGAYVYIREAYGKGLSFFYGWTSIIGGYCTLYALLSLAFVQYLSFFFPISPFMTKVLASLLIIGLAYINYRGVKLSVNLNNIFTIGKLGAIGLVIVGGLFVFKRANFTPLVGTAGWGTAATAAVPALLAFGGYTALAYMGGEIKDPDRNVPRATIIGILIVMAVYVLLNVVSIGAIPIAELAKSAKPVASVAQAIFGPVGGGIVAVGALMSIFGALNAITMQYARVPFAMAKDGVMFAAGAKVHPNYKTPYVSIIILALVGLAELWTGTFLTLLLVQVFLARAMDCLTAAALMVLRKKRPELKRPYKMWGYPVTTVLAIAIVVYLLTKVAPKQILESFILAATALPAYWIFKYIGRRQASGENPEHD